MEDKTFATQALVKSIYRRRFFSKHIEPTPELIRLLDCSLYGSQDPISFFYLWGMHKRHQKNRYDLEAMSLLAEVLKHISNVLSRPTTLSLILADAHASINGIDQETIKQYGLDIKQEAANHGWYAACLSSLWKDAELNMDTVCEMAKNISDTEVDHLLLKSAKKYCKVDDKFQGAKRYLTARLMEKKIIEKRFRDCIHITAADPRFFYLQPNLPTFQVWTLKRGISRKPWFID